VDTHVHRLVQSNHLDFIATKTPEQTERELKKLFPPVLWRKINYLLVKWGQYVCKSNTKRCSCWQALEIVGFKR
jgi:endonuclease-3